MNFEFGITRAPGQIIFGAGQRHVLGRLAHRYGKRVLICTDQRFAWLDAMQEMREDLLNQGCEVEMFDGTGAELPLSSVVACVDSFRRFDPEVVVGIGGGSCLDMAKLVALLLTHGGPLSRFYGELQVPGPILPVIAMPTTAGTGSEVTPVAVLADPEHEMKVGVSSYELIPTAAICDPELTITCPTSLTALSGADAMAHAIEAFAAVSRGDEKDIALERVFVGKNVLSDQFALTAMRLILTWLSRVVEDGHNLEGRSALMLASTLAGLAFGTAGTAAAHAIQYPVGAATHTPHGLGIGVLLPYTMEFNLPAARPIYARIGREVLGIGGTDDDTAIAIISRVRRLFMDIGIPISLRDLGLSETLLGWAAKKSMGATRLVENNPRLLDQAAISAILKHALVGAENALSENNSVHDSSTDSQYD
jgi:alcohol dehydrogenase